MNLGDLYAETTLIIKKNYKDNSISKVPIRFWYQRKLTICSVRIKRSGNSIDYPESLRLFLISQLPILNVLCKISSKALYQYTLHTTPPPSHISYLDLSKLWIFQKLKSPQKVGMQFYTMDEIQKSVYENPEVDVFF